MAKMRKALALFLALLTPQAQDLLIDQSPPRKYTIDNIVPTTDKASGNVNCCPEGAEFDGKSCVLAIPICPNGSQRDDEKCVFHSKPLWDTGYELIDGLCVTTTPPTCEANTKVKGSHCVIDDTATCGTGYVLEGNICVSLTPPSCPNGQRFNGNSCASINIPKCQDGSKLEGGLFLMKTSWLSFWYQIRHSKPQAHLREAT